MELSIFIRLHAQSGQRAALSEAIQDVVAATRQEPECLFIEGYQATRCADQFHIHSRWVDESAFDLHATLPHTMSFLAIAGRLVDREVEVARALPIRRIP